MSFLRKSARAPRLLARLSKVPCRVDEAAHVDPTARHIFLINCLTHVGDAMEGHACCATRARDVSKAVEGHMAGLAGSTAGALLARCNLIEPAERMRWEPCSAGQLLY